MSCIQLFEYKNATSVTVCLNENHQSKPKFGTKN